MAIRIRRGLEADRLSVTPDAGEFLYTTDTKEVYIGDGSTVGGTLVGGVGSLFITSILDSANIDLDVTSGVLTADITDTAVTPNTYGDAANIPQITVDQKGRVTSVTDIPVSIPSGSVTSVGLIMPSAFTVSNSPITSSGDIAVTGAGLVSQYVRGDGSLANFPSSTGGGASQSFYLNGSVSQGTFGGVAFREMDRVPILGAGTDFTINTNGYIQSFITDANVPNLLEIPAGNWNFETYLSASSGGGSPSFYVELYKWDGTTLSLIASNSATPESITNGTTIDAYFSALAVPQTALLATDRLAVRIYVNNSGRTITLHTEDNHLCQVITTFSTGLTALNGLTDQVQNFAVGTSGTDFAINSATAIHTFNLPIASATNTGKLSSADWSIFNGKQNALGFTPENVANKSNSFTASSTTTYASTKALVDGLATKQDLLPISIPYKRSLLTFTGTTNERALDIIALDVNSLDYLYRFFVWGRSSAGGGGNIRIRIGTYAAPIDGAVGVNSIGQQSLLATYTTISNNRFPFTRNINIVGGAGGSALAFPPTFTTALTDENIVGTASTIIINTTIQHYFYISYQQGGVMVFTSDSAVVTKIKLT